MNGAPPIEVVWFLGVLATVLVFVAGRFSKSTDARDNRTALPFGILGALVLLVVAVSAYREGNTVGQRVAQGKPIELAIGETYSVVSSNNAYIELRDKNGYDRVYAVDAKLIPSLDRFWIPKFFKRFKYEKREKLVIVVEDPPKPAPPATVPENNSEKK